ncbi:hypothetical protein HK105_201967 [Polyrhizophydium stewartii]|uniref:Uncharacterized protein n=1 Tax=Polyrhizophydium stewartii TaxID=2732419 RepID=A0ABR4NGE2_9FUNG
MGVSVESGCVLSVRIDRLMAGDVFYIYRCRGCTGGETDCFERPTLSWSFLAQLVLYDMHMENPGTSYFKTKDILARFETYWDYLRPGIAMSLTHLFCDFMP